MWITGMFILWALQVLTGQGVAITDRARKKNPLKRQRYNSLKTRLRYLKIS